MQKHTTKRPPKQSPSKRDKPTGRTNTHGPAAATSPRETDYSLTSQKTLVSKKAPPAIEIKLKKNLSGKTLKTWRIAHGYSAHALAVELGVSRSYIKSIEGGSLAASQKLIARFAELRERIGDTTAPAQEDTPRTVTSKHQLRKRLLFSPSRNAARPAKHFLCRVRRNKNFAAALVPNSPSKNAKRNKPRPNEHNANERQAQNYSRRRMVRPHCHGRNAIHRRQRTTRRRFGFGLCTACRDSRVHEKMMCAKFLRRTRAKHAV